MTISRIGELQPGEKLANATPLQHRRSDQRRIGFIGPGFYLGFQLVRLHRALIIDPGNQILSS
jgi:hypothetical protein